MRLPTKDEMIVCAALVAVAVAFVVTVDSFLVHHDLTLTECAEFMRSLLLRKSGYGN